SVGWIQDHEAAAGDLPQVVEVRIGDAVVRAEVRVAANEVPCAVVVPVDRAEVPDRLLAADQVRDDDRQPVCYEGLDQCVAGAYALHCSHTEGLGIERHTGQRHAIGRQ